MFDNTPYWSPVCSGIKSTCTSKHKCSCYNDYLLWTKDFPTLSFEEWKVLMTIEYDQRNP